MIRTESLTKDYGKLVAVRDLSLHVERGQIYGFLGPNGAGKTTTISMILGILKPTSGTITIMGQNLYENYFGIKRKIGVVSEHQHFYGEMTAWDYLLFFSKLYEVENPEKRISELLELVRLTDRRDERLRGYSKGMQQKISIARALLNDPELLILDEPVSSLDPHGVKEVRDIIKFVHSQGKTVFVSSHILSEIEKTCDKVAILNKGRLVAEDVMSNLKKDLSQETELQIELETANDSIAEKLLALPFVNSVAGGGKYFTVRTKNDNDYRKAIAKLISDNGSIILGMNTKEMSLEDAFVTITENNISLLTKEGAA